MLRRIYTPKYKTKIPAHSMHFASCLQPVSVHTHACSSSQLVKSVGRHSLKLSSLMSQVRSESVYCGTLFLIKIKVFKSYGIFPCEKRASVAHPPPMSFTRKQVQSLSEETERVFLIYQDCYLVLEFTFLSLKFVTRNLQVTLWVVVKLSIL